MGDLAVEARNLVREFKRRSSRPGSFRSRLLGRSSKVRAVDGVSLEVQQGETVGYLGANGAGKSTTIKLLSGLLLPTAGSVEIHGFDPWRDRRACSFVIGVVFGHRSQLVYDTPLIDSFKLIRDLYAIPESKYRTRLDELVSILDAAPLLDRPVRSLSLGERMRGDLIAAFLPAPQVLFLDEPTIGLDVLAKQSVYSFIDRLRVAGDTTIMLTSHDMRDIERLCERIVVIDGGCKVYDGGIDALKQQLEIRHTLEADVEGAADVFPSVPSFAGSAESEAVQTPEGLRLRIRYDPRALSSAVVIANLLDRYHVTGIRISEATLDDVIEALYRKLGHPYGMERQK